MKTIYLKALLNETLRSVGFPVTSLAYGKNGNIISIKSNSIGCSETSHKTHAEYLMSIDKKFINHKGKLTILITYPPCSHCLAKLNSMKKDIEIKYLFDVWGKRYKNYIKSQNTSIKCVNVNTPETKELWSIVEKRYDRPGHRLSKKHLLELSDSKRIMKMAPKPK